LPGSLEVLLLKKAKIGIVVGMKDGKESRESRESSIANEETHDRDRHKKKPVDKGGQDGDTSGEERRSDVEGGGGKEKL
jgi:hypothetical protein